MSTRTPKVPERWSGKAEEHRWKLAKGINALLRGKSNNAMQVTLDTGTSTLVSDSRVTVSTVPLLVPMSDSAKATPVWATVTGGQVTINHDAGAADRVFGLVLVG